MLKLRNDSLEWALKHIENYGDTDIFPVPFEYEAIRYLWDKNTRELPNGSTLKRIFEKSRYVTVDCEGF